MRRVDVDIKETDRGEQYNLILSYNQLDHLSESTFGFERRMFIESKPTSKQIFDDTPSLKHFKGGDFRKYPYIESDSLFDFHFLCGLSRLMLVRDNLIYRLIAWGNNSIDKYRLYTKDWEQFCKSVGRITEGRLVPTEKLWSSGYVVNVTNVEVGPAITPLTDGFESQFLELVRSQFNQVLESGAYRIAESDVYVAQANVENAIGMLHNAARRFTPLKADFENSHKNEFEILDFQI